MRVLILFAALLTALTTAQLHTGAHASDPATRFLPTRDEAYAIVVAWGYGFSGAEAARTAGVDCEAIIASIQEAAREEAIQFELLLAVLATETRFAPEVSFGRRNGWIEWAASQGEDGGEFPEALADPRMGAQQLGVALGQREQLYEALGVYWSGPRGKENKRTMKPFRDEALRQLAALEPYLAQRMREGQ